MIQSSYFEILPWDNGLLYSGEQLNPNFFRQQAKRLETGKSSIIFWDGPVDVSVEFMKDVDDVRENLSIRSAEMTNIVVQLHNWNDPVTATFIQRTLCRSVLKTINNYLEDTSTVAILNGNDIYWVDRETGLRESWKKFSVSIVAVYPHVSMIHFGYNLQTTEAPEGVRIAGLDQLDLYKYKNFIIRAAVAEFVQEFEDVLGDAYKSLGR